MTASPARLRTPRIQGQSVNLSRISAALLTKRHAIGGLYGVMIGSAFTASAVGTGAVMAAAICGS